MVSKDQGCNEWNEGRGAGGGASALPLKNFSLQISEERFKLQQVNLWMIKVSYSDSPDPILRRTLLFSPQPT